MRVPGSTKSRPEMICLLYSCVQQNFHSVLKITLVLIGSVSYQDIY